MTHETLEQGGGSRGGFSAPTAQTPIPNNDRKCRDLL